MRYDIEFVKKVPIISIGNRRAFLDTCFPGGIISAKTPIQRHFGIGDLLCAGFGWLKRYTVIDYRSRTLITSDEPLEMVADGEVDLVLTNMGIGSYPRVKLSINGVSACPFIDTGAAVSYMRNLSEGVKCVGKVSDSDWNGASWITRLFRVPCVFDEHAFDAIFGESCQNRHVPAEGVLGYDFFYNFIVLIDKVNKRLSYKTVKKG